MLCKTKGDAMGYYYAEEEIEAMKGKELLSVDIAANKESVTFRFMDGTSQSFQVEGDCCSRSWIEHLELPCDVRGLVIEGFHEDYMDATGDDKYNPPTPDDEYSHRMHDCLKVYSSKFVTSKGAIVLEYRNSSNGYYGGSLVAV